MPEVGKRLRGRIFLRNATTQSMCYVIWIELRGTNFYWGIPHPTPDLPSTRIVPGQPTAITVPADFGRFPRASAKTSFHASGVTHVTSDGNGSQVLRDTYVGPITDFREPTLFAAMYTAVLGKRHPYPRNPGRGGVSAHILDIPESHWNRRWYVDFSLTPSGAYPPWPGVFLKDGVAPRVQTTPFLSEELDLILVVRATPIEGELNSWQPDKDLLVRVTPPEVRRPRSGMD
ncbi:hypothetical protein IM660_03405 [Ruania alkalisoli]|uniref:Uncharacterized protein n=1 Tax=Ruania alkalisoli TaxID=2779775 RepID=A0A7M1SUV2_9MICO|nr:hypothetical protein [Ruania alkalisoli]QOR71359.1 hypothetical protein IM660_03405 [Ruania alkalisoli]